MEANEPLSEAGEQRLAREDTRGVDASQAMDKVDRSTTSPYGTCIRGYHPGLRGGCQLVEMA